MAKDRRRFIRVGTSIVTDSIPLILKGQGEEINFRGRKREAGENTCKRRGGEGGYSMW